eukprot:4161901-Ditylum_brightwellii.AAC.1
MGDDDASPALASAVSGIMDAAGRSYTHYDHDGGHTIPILLQIEEMTDTTTMILHQHANSTFMIDSNITLIGSCSNRCSKR